MVQDDRLEFFRFAEDADALGRGQPGQADDGRPRRSDGHLDGLVPDIGEAVDHLLVMGRRRQDEVEDLEPGGGPGVLEKLVQVDLGQVDVGDQEELALEDRQGFGIAIDRGHGKVPEAVLSAQQPEVEKHPDVLGGKLEAAELVQKLVDQPDGFVLAVLDRSDRLGGDERTAAGKGLDKPAADELFIGPLDRSPGGPDFLGQIPLGRKLFAGAKEMVFNLVIKEGNDLLIGRRGRGAFIQPYFFHFSSIGLFHFILDYSFYIPFKMACQGMFFNWTEPFKTFFLLENMRSGEYNIRMKKRATGTDRSRHHAWSVLHSESPSPATGKSF